MQILMSDVSTKITETVPIFFFIYNLEKKEVEFISPQFYELTKDIDSEEGNSLKKCIHPDYQESFDKFFEDLSGKNKYEGSVELKSNDQLKGAEWLELNTFPVIERNMAEVRQVVGHIVNITEKKKIYDVLREEKEHINNVLNMMVHDLRAPFNRVHMIAELLESEMTDAEYEKYKPYITMLRKQGEQSMQLIKSLLRLATLKGSVRSLDLNIHDLRNLVKDSLHQFKNRIEEKKLNVSCEFPDQHVRAKLDAVLFKQVLTNLFSNAIKFTPAGGTISTRLTEEKDKVVLVVKDSGIGIPEKHLKVLFQSMRSARRPGLEGEESTGLGLFICKEIVKMHEGKISVESKEGEGSTFKIVLPFTEPSAAYY